MRSNAQDKIQELIRAREDKEKSSSKSEPVSAASPANVGELDENPLGDVEEWEDQENTCYVLRRRPGESPGLELWFSDNSVQVESYSYFQRAILNTKRDTMLLMFSGAEVQIHGRGLLLLVSLLNERKLVRLIEQGADMDDETEKIFIYEMVAEVASLKG